MLGCVPKNKEYINLIDLIPQNTSLVAQINDSISLKNSKVLSKLFSLNSKLKNTILNIIPKKALQHKCCLLYTSPSPRD